MSDINNTPDELEELDEENENYITLTDDDGNEVSFEIIDTVEFEDRLFAVLLPFDEEDDGIIILEIISDEASEYDDFVSIDDQLAAQVYEVFKKNYSGDYQFE